MIEKKPIKLEAGMTAQESFGMSNQEVKDMKKKTEWKNRKYKEVSKSSAFIEKKNIGEKTDYTKSKGVTHLDCWKCSKQKCIKCGIIIKKLGSYNLELNKFTCLDCFLAECKEKHFAGC